MDSVLPPSSLTKLQGADTQTNHIFANLRHLEKQNDKCNLPKVPMIVMHVMNHLEVRIFEAEQKAQLEVGLACYSMEQ